MRECRSTLMPTKCMSNFPVHSLGAQAFLAALFSCYYAPVFPDTKSATLKVIVELGSPAVA